MSKKSFEERAIAYLIVQLRMEMVLISEEHWCAGWQIDLEYILWDAILNKQHAPRNGERFQWGMPFDTEAINRVQELSEIVNGWWISTEDSYKFVTMEKWLKMYEEHINPKPKPYVKPDREPHWLDEERKRG